MSATDTTTTSVYAEEFRKDLVRLLDLAASVATAEAKLEACAADMDAGRKWERLNLSGRMLGAVNGAVEGALNAAKNDDNRSDCHGLEKAQEVQDALVLFDFVIAHEHPDQLS